LNPHHPGWYWFVPCFDAYRKGEYKTSLEFAHKVMPGFGRSQLAIAANCGQPGQKAAANDALQTLLRQRPDIAKLPGEELAIWRQPDMVEHLIAGLCKAGRYRGRHPAAHCGGCKTEQRGSMAVRKYYPDDMKAPRKA
jgi:hypothetical protein